MTAHPVDKFVPLNDAFGQLNFFNLIYLFVAICALKGCTFFFNLHAFDFVKRRVKETLRNMSTSMDVNVAVAFLINTFHYLNKVQIFFLWGT